MFEAIINNNGNGKSGLAVRGHFAGEFENPIGAYKELRTLINIEIDQLEQKDAVDIIDTKINNRNKVVVDCVVIDDSVFEDTSVGWKLIWLEDYIDDLISWTGEIKRNSNSQHRANMKQNLKLLMTWDDQYIWSSISTNDFVSPSHNQEKFNKICQEVLDANRAVS